MRTRPTGIKTCTGCQMVRALRPGLPRCNPCPPPPLTPEAAAVLDLADRFPALLSAGFAAPRVDVAAALALAPHLKLCPLDLVEALEAFCAGLRG
jgi:hypothetical protein